jgi:hypothetical protein
MNPTLNLALDRIEYLVHRAKYMKKRGEVSLSEFLLEEAKLLAASMDNEDEELFVMKYYRYSSDSFGIDFEITHGDPELMFGGVV